MSTGSGTGGGAGGRWVDRRGPGAVPAPTAPNPSTAQARVLLDELARCGVRHVVLCPGSRSTALAVAAHEHPRLLLHVALDERGAGYLAVGIGRVTGQPAAVVVTSGTAVANLLPAVVEADHDRVPLLLLTADRPPELHGVGANQTITQVGIFGDSTRLVVDVGVADQSDVGVADQSDVGVADQSDVGVADQSDVGVADQSDVGVADQSDVGVGGASDVGVADAVEPGGGVTPVVAVGESATGDGAGAAADLSLRSARALASSDSAAVARWRWTACRAHGAAVGHPVEVPSVVELDSWQAPGPVQLDVPFREPTVPVTDDGRTRARPFLAPLTGRPDHAPWQRSTVEPHVPPAHVVTELAERFAAEPSGVVVVGAAVADVGAAVALADVLGWPVVAEPHARIGSGVAAAGPVLRHGTLLLGTAGWRDAHRPRTVLRVGRTTVARETTALLDGADDLVVVDAHGGWMDIDDPRDTLVRAAPGPTLAALRDALDGTPGGRSAWLEEWLAADEEVAAVVDRVLAVEPSSEPAVARAVLGAVPAGGALLVGSSMPIRDVDLVAGRRADVDVHANRGASGIDGTVATALGVALGRGRPAVALVGDLTLLHDTTAWHLREDPAGPPADLVVVVVDNDGGGIFSFLPQRQHVAAFERLFGTPHGLDLADLARLHRLEHVPPSALPDADAVAGAVRAGLDAGGRHLVHVRTDREENLAVHRRLRAAVADALRPSGPTAV